MKHLRFNFYTGMALLIMSSVACGLFAAPPMATLPTEAPVKPSTTASLIPAPTDAAVSPTLVAIDLTGPPMEVGSLFPYVDGSILVAVPGGPFTMGHGGSDNPVHTVTLSDFWIYQAKVTNQQYALCVNAGLCKTPDLIDNVGYTDVVHANDPVTGVKWDQASSYCSFVHGALPTEAQWEKTARGPDGNLYPWGEHEPTCDYLNFNNCVGKTTNVTKYPQGQSYYHALDMEGNAFEWVADWYNALYYKNSPLQDPLGPDTGQQRSIRSAGYKSNADETPASTRRFDLPNSHRRDLGFRCVVADPTYFAPLCQAIGLFGPGPGGGSSGLLQEDCPKVGIGLTPNCQKGIVTVTFTDDHSPDPNAVVSGVASCSSPVPITPGVFPQVYDCSSTTTATIDSKCIYTSSGLTQCAPHYNYNDTTDVCEWDGTGTLGTQCLPGYNYDPARQCCTAQSGTGVNYPICPTGTVRGYIPGGNLVCVPLSVAMNPLPQPQHSEPVLPPNPATCTGGGKNSGGETPTGDVTPTGGQCPAGQQYVCVQNPACKNYPPTSACTLPQVCGCQ